MRHSMMMAVGAMGLALAGCAGSPPEPVDPASAEPAIAPGRDSWSMAPPWAHVVKIPAGSPEIPVQIIGDEHTHEILDGLG